jgi:antitoxin component YwqK of YwqJK toxin-antitoxin module
MNKVILFLVVAVLFTACDDSTPKKSLEGKEVISRYTNGIAQMERDYKMVDGKRFATYEWEYYEDGNVLKEGPLSSGEKRDGIWRSFYRDGILWSEGEYKNGIRDGRTVTYHSNGKKYYEGQFVRAQKSGIWKFYKENGDSDGEIDFDKKKQTKVTVDEEKLKEMKKSAKK